MRVDLFDFDLPEDRIALRPASPRDAARLLVVDPGRGLSDASVRDLPELLRPGDHLVFNDTRVIAAELRGERQRPESVAKVTVTLIERLGASPVAGLGAAGQAPELRRSHPLRRRQ